MPINRELDKDAAHINNGILLSHKKEHNNAICSKWMDLEIPILSEVSQAQKDKYHMMSLICEWVLFSGLGGFVVVLLFVGQR